MTSKLIKPLSISWTQVSLCIHYGCVQSQLWLCSLTHQAIHHRWQRLLWKLAAVLSLGTNHPNEAKIASGKPCDAKDCFCIFLSDHPVHQAVKEYKCVFTWQRVGQSGATLSCWRSGVQPIWKIMSRGEYEKAMREWGTMMWEVEPWSGGFEPTLCSFTYLIGFKFCSWLNSGQYTKSQWYWKWAENQEHRLSSKF